jgi:hypothetical protein
MIQIAVVSSSRFSFLQGEVVLALAKDIYTSSLCELKLKKKKKKIKVRLSTQMTAEIGLGRQARFQRLPPTAVNW